MSIESKKDEYSSCCKHPQSENMFFYGCSSEIFNSSMWTWFITKAENTTNLFGLSFNEINAMKKKDLEIEGRVDNNIKSLCDQGSCLSENLAKLMESNEKLSSQFIVVKKVNTLLDKRATEFENSQAKAEQYSRRNNVEISGMPHEILDINLEDKVINICKDAGIIQKIK